MGTSEVGEMLHHHIHRIVPPKVGAEAIIKQGARLVVTQSIVIRILKIRCVQGNQIFSVDGGSLHIRIAIDSQVGIPAPPDQQQAYQKDL